MESKQREEILNKLAEAESSDGFLMTITIKKGDELLHTFFTNEFLKADLMTSLDECASLIQEKTK